MKKVLLCVFVLSVFGQRVILCQDIARDTLQLEEVDIVKSRKEYLSEGAQKETLSKRQLAQFSFRTLGEVLQYSTSINIKSYGSPGASSSISLRGLGASHTQVNWNGFPVNSVTLGSSDISNIPILSNQSVSIIPGASGVNYGSGTFGGALNIDYHPGNEPTTNIGSATLSYGSMNTIKGAAIYQVQHSKWSLSGSIWGDQSDGDFKYFDEIKQESYNRENADYQQKGFQQYFSFKNSKYSELKGGVWGQIKDLNIPNIEGSSLENFENQKDSILRMFLHWKKVMNTSALNLKTAWFYADQHYTDKESEDADSLLIDSRIKSKKWMVDASYRVYLFENMTFDAACDYSYTTADVASYNGSKYDYALALVTGLKYMVNKLKVNASLRKDWGKRSNSDILLSLGASYTLKEESWFIRSAYSQKFRRPTFNDMYWDPGGDPDLKQEKGWSYELGNVYVFKTDEVGEFKLDISTYYGYINNMIVWRPEGSTWYAKNYEDVLTRGVDVKLYYSKSVQELNVHTSYALSYNKATIEDTVDDSVEPGQSLYYAPEWISSLNVNIDYHHFYLDVNWRLVSERTYDDNGSTLDPYALVSTDLSKELFMGKQKITCSLGVDNVFAEQYQMVRSYPMPDRLYQIKLKYKF
jgi:outer membrane cobalamin receptor